MLTEYHKRKRPTAFMWFVVFCYIFVSAIVPPGFMPSSLDEGSSPFVLCHGDQLSSQWLSSGNKYQKQPSLPHGSSAVGDSEPSMHLDHMRGEASSNPKSNQGSSHPSDLHAEIQCQFSSGLFSSLIESQCRFHDLRDPHSVCAERDLQAIHVTQIFSSIQARAPPLPFV